MDKIYNMTILKTLDIRQMKKKKKPVISKRQKIK